ncbi:hypothetical protein [Hoyosella altamirensis]|uniref:Uncharacterized protein n=1 Tax=Hoyosella altamirensis TaxID=616997 RepID=A0A839RLE9_9ACTN|nr:hypothetical protein [Hoyosella altamirensis]MBB3037535.1 hypothetical protein [Hoyosella altamirensis]
MVDVEHELSVDRRVYLEAPHRNLLNLSWLDNVAWSHDAVVAAAAKGESAESFNAFGLIKDRSECGVTRAFARHRRWFGSRVSIEGAG